MPVTTSWYRRGFILAVLVFHIALLVEAGRRNFATVDETGHIPAGLFHWQRGGFELYRVNPPLPRMLATAPVWLADPKDEFGPVRDAPGARPEWTAANAFALANQDRYMDLVRLARLGGILWSLVGAWVVMRWSRELFGERAGLLALVLWCFGPNIIAYAALVTPDIPCTVAGLAACYVFRAYVRAPSWSGAWFAGLLLGAALLTRSTWLLLFALWPVLALVVLWQRPARAGRVLLRLGQGGLIASLGLLVLNVGYSFRGAGHPLGEFAFVSEAFADERPSPQVPGNRFRGTFLERLPVPVPADYVLGIDLQRRDFEAGWPFYIDGEWSKGGKWYFYLYALLLKVPLGCLALFALAMALLVLQRSAVPWREEVLISAPALAILVLVSSQTGLNYFRYILPLLPFGIIFASRCASLRTSSCKPFVALVVALTLGSVVSGLRVSPHSLSYFNEAAGGPEQGHRHLIDSNLDWGQDLLDLREWLDANPEERQLGLAYFNVVDARVLGIEYELPPLDPRPGRYAVSVHFVHGGSFYTHDGKGVRRFVSLNNYAYFRHFLPIAKVGHSIWIYDLEPGEVNRVRTEMGLPTLD